MRHGQFQWLLQQLTPMEFEHFVADVLNDSARFSDVSLGAAGGPDSGIDIEAIETDPLLPTPRRWLFQVKKTRVVGVDVARYMGFVASQSAAIGSTQIVLVASGSITRRAQEHLEHMGVQVWGAQRLADLASPEILAKYFGLPEVATKDVASSDKAASFRAALDATVAGKKAWSAYQRLVADVLEFLFCPPLEAPRYELADSDVRNRRDIIFENTAAEGFWAQARSLYSAHYLVVDAKNYAKPIPKRAVLDIAHYLKPYGCGMFALLVSRRGPGPAAAHASREQWIGGNKMIVHLSDDDLREMLELRADGGEPQEIIRKAIADFRMSL